MRLVRERAQRYFAFLAWLIGDAFLRYRWRLLLLLAANIGGLACHAGALYLSYHYAAALESDKTLHLLGVALRARSSFELLIVVAGAVLALTLAAAFLIMRGRVEAVTLARDYGDFCSRRIYSLVSRLPSSATAEVNHDLSPTGPLRELARGYAARCGVVLRMLARSLLSFGTVLVAGVALVVIDAVLSAILAAILAVAGVFLYRANLASAAGLAATATALGRVGPERRAVWERVQRSAAPLAVDDSVLAGMFRSGAAGKVAEATTRQHLAMERGYFIAQVALGCAIFLILLVQGSATLRAESNWSVLVAYLGVFSIFASHFASTMRLAVAVNRFYPLLAAYARFVQRAVAAVPARAEGVERYRLDAPALAGPPSPLEARRGERLALVLAGELERQTLGPLAQALCAMAGDAVLSPVVLPWYASARFTPLGGTLRENYGFPAGYDAAQLEADLRALGLGERFARVGKALDRPLRPGEQQALDAPLSFVLAALAGIRGGAGVIVLEERALAALERGASQALLDMAAGLLVVHAYAHDALQSLGARGERALVLCDGERVLGWASIESYRAGEPQVARALAELATRKPEQEGAAALEPDALEELA